MNTKKILPFCALLLCGSMTAEEQSHEEVFTNIYTHAVWGTDESGKGYSGGGSTLATTEEYRYFLEDLMMERDIKTVADIGCGYWEFSKAVDWSDKEYTGYDVVSFVIDSNKQKYETPNIHFVHTNVLESELPEVDLVICKDLLAHFSNDDVKTLLAQLPKCKYCLFVSDINPVTLTSDNTDVERGGYRPVDLTQEPFAVRGTKVFKYWANNYLKQVFLVETESAI
jgi:2-polyprenyl-3-methyl-5-hydroxy-6-metoxy-1,4-benzoquinol methylase